MKVQTLTDLKEPTVLIDGELDGHTAEYVRLTLDDLLASFAKASAKRVVLDLSKLEFMDSTGIGVLLGRYKKWGLGKIEICIQNPKQNIDRVLSLSGIYQIMPKLV